MPKEQQFDASFKILVIGNSGAGKSNILLRFASNQFRPELQNTIGVDFKTKYVTIQDKRVKLLLWDTAGQQRFKTLTTSFYRGADGILIVYDVTDRQSYDNVITWYDQMNKSINKKVACMLVGNKIDLSQRRSVSENQGKSLGNKYGIPFFQSSAKTGQNINQIFINLAKNMYANTDGKQKKFKPPKPKLFNQQQQPSDPVCHCCQT